MTRRSRRSLSHLFAVAGVSGLITLAVAVTDADDVWLAVGPLLLVILDTLAFSPVVQSHARRAARWIPGMAPPKPRGFVADFSSRQAGYAPASYSYSGLRWALPLAVVIVVGLVANFNAPIWGFVNGNAVAVGLAAFVGVAFALALATLEMGVLSSVRDSHDTALEPGRGPAAPWLQHQLTAAGDSPLSIVVIKPADISAPALPTACANVIRTKVGQVHYLSETEILLVATPDYLRSALSFFGLGPSPLQPAQPARMGEVTYPDDGRDPDALIRQARLRLAQSSE
ncbi:MAG TPA: hypothetical protein VN845_09565 [Solirubrobacteraceae bacterium]|nr:hypothetical protein [Solirubrobacteraceae bacterium]